MKSMHIILLALAALLPGLLLAQDKPEKGKQKIVIIKKSVDENGNKVVEKIVREADGDEQLEWSDEEGNVIIKLGEGDVEWESLEEIDVGLEGLDESLRHMEVELDELQDGMKNLKIVVEPGGEVIILKDGDATVERAADDENENELLEPYEGQPTLELEAFEAFPNPADNQLTVRFTGEQAPVTVRLLDAAGKQVYKEYIKDFGGRYDQLIGLEGVPEGLLLLTVEQEGRMFVDKVMIARQ